MIRRLEIAQAMLHRPSVLFLDEPTVGPRSDRARRRCGSTSASCATATGTTIVLTTHYMEEADALCDRVAVMHRGRIAAIGTPDRAEGRHRAGAPRSTTSSSTTPAPASRLEALP